MDMPAVLIQVYGWMCIHGLAKNKKKNIKPMFLGFKSDNKTKRKKVERGFRGIMDVQFVQFLSINTYTQIFWFHFCLSLSVFLSTK